MVKEARREAVDSGLAPLTGGWFVVNARDAAWLTNDAFGSRYVFEADGPVLRKRPDLDTQTFPDPGLTLAVVSPGQPSGLYQAETNQEDFLVLIGACVLLIEGEERPLQAWDFVHCPPGTEHVFVGAGDGPPCDLHLGSRTLDKGIVYPRSELVGRHRAGVETETSSPAEAYAPFPDWQPERPQRWKELPWVERPEAPEPRLARIPSPRATCGSRSATLRRAE
jgi:uncharacterized cupin superfamily protein